MNDEERTYKYGQFGYGKFVYPKDSLAYMKEFFNKYKLVKKLTQSLNE